MFSNSIKFMIRQNIIQSSRNLYTGRCLLAGHSKWANIKHTKGAKDMERSLMFNRYSKRLRLAIQEGGSANPELNATLRSIIDEAKRKNMPVATIQNTLKKYSDPNGIKLTKFYFDLRALGKVYMVVLLYTENLPATKQNMQAVLKKFPAAFTESRNIFSEYGLLEAIVPDQLKKLDEAALEEACTEHAIECGAQEVEIGDFETKIINFICNPNEIVRLEGQLTKLGYTVESGEHVFMPNVFVQLNDTEMKTYQTLVDKLKAIEGVEEVYDNISSAEETASAQQG